MTAEKLREEFLNYFKSKGHSVVPSSSLLPDDPSVLLTTAGMQQFKPYYTAKADPLSSPHTSLSGKPIGSKNSVSVQKCFRTSDIDEVGDETHLTFFEMLGNFSFGGYFKEEAINFAYEFLTKKLGITIDYVTVFKGDESVPMDMESENEWNNLGFSKENGNVKFSGREDNFWGPTGSEGPCGPTTEIYIKSMPESGQSTEIWNIVFNEYYSNKDKTLERLKNPGVDTGMGLERLAMVSQEVKNIFETDLFGPILSLIPKNMPERIRRIVADHARGAVFLLADGILPSNKEAGYILRRLLRRIIVHEDMSSDGAAGHSGYGFNIHLIMEKIISEYGSSYPKLISQKQIILDEFEKEREKFSKTLRKGLRELNRIGEINAKSAFYLYESFGLPYEIIKELGEDKAKGLGREEFDSEFDKHREQSRAGKEKKFGGHGLILDTGELKASNEEELKKVTRLHTATHLLQAALRKVLGDNIHQGGSDITAERLRFDFHFERKPSSVELSEVEDLVNRAIEHDLDMGYEEMPYGEAIKTGALYFEKEKYPPNVRVYTAKDSNTGEVFSRELCGGPHVSHTGELKSFKIFKEESVGAGLRRIRATVGEK